MHSITLHALALSLVPTRPNLLPITQPKTSRLLTNHDEFTTIAFSLQSEIMDRAYGLCSNCSIYTVGHYYRTPPRFYYIALEQLDTIKFSRNVW